MSEIVTALDYEEKESMLVGLTLMKAIAEFKNAGLSIEKFAGLGYYDYSIDAVYSLACKFLNAEPIESESEDEDDYYYDESFTLAIPLTDDLPEELLLEALDQSGLHVCDGGVDEKNNTLVFVWNYQCGEPELEDFLDLLLQVELLRREKNGAKY